MNPTVTKALHIDAMLCDFAQVHAQRLFTVGAGTNFAQSPSPSPPYPVHLWLGMVVLVPWDRLRVPHRLKVDLADESRLPPPRGQPPPTNVAVFEADFNVEPPPLTVRGDDVAVPVAIPLVRTLPSIGPWATVVYVAGEEARRVTFRVVPATRAPAQN